MKQSTILRPAALATAGLLFAATASASPLLYDQNVTPGIIFGSGNANGSFTVDRQNGVELGLRGKLRYDASGQPQNTFNSNHDGTYSFDAGVAPTKSSPTAVWSVEWSINTNYNGNTGWNLSDLTYKFGVDSNPSQGTSFSASDIINVPYYDHAIGTNATANGAGTVATDSTSYASLIGANNVAQNSWQANWMLNSTFDPTANGTYGFYLEAFNGTASVARTEIQVIVGNGGAAPVPEPASIALLGLGLVGIGYRHARRRKASV